MSPFDIFPNVLLGRFSKCVPLIIIFLIKNGQPASQVEQHRLPVLVFVTTVS